MREQIKVILAEVLDLEPDAIPDDADSGTLSGWDSLRHLELMLMLEARFDVHISTESMIELVSLEKIDDYLSEHVAGYAR
jgi:acyl carrier protein